MYTRNCPKCNIEIIYSNKHTQKTAISKNSICRSCASSGKNNANYGKTGEANSFYGHKHSDVTIAKLKSIDKSYTKTKEFKDSVLRGGGIRTGSANPMYGKTYYEKWIEKYGKEEADRLQELKRAKNKLASSGSNNPMFGKPTPKKAGNGWSGWYKNLFFRSLRELSYIVNVLEPSGKEWKSAESIRIPYKNYDGSDRTYSPDFICDGQLIEIKPHSLIETPLIRLKSEAATNYCELNGLTFLIIDIDVVTLTQLRSLIESGDVILTDRTKEKYSEYN